MSSFYSFRGCSNSTAAWRPARETSYHLLWVERATKTVVMAAESDVVTTRLPRTRKSSRDTTSHPDWSWMLEVNDQPSKYGQSLQTTTDFRQSRMNGQMAGERRKEETTRTKKKKNRISTLPTLGGRRSTPPLTSPRLSDSLVCSYRGLRQMIVGIRVH